MFNHLMGAKLKEFRLQSGLSIASAAATVGVTSSFISMVENGKSGISLQKVHALLALYGKTLSDLTAASSSESRIINLSSAPEALSEPGVKVFCLAKAGDPYYLGGFTFISSPAHGSNMTITAAWSMCWCWRGALSWQYIRFPTDQRSCAIFERETRRYTPPIPQHSFRNTSDKFSALFVVEIDDPDDGPRAGMT